MPQCGDSPADKVKQDEAKFPQNSLNIITKNPEVKHVPSQMSYSRMQKHGGVKGRVCSKWVVNKLVGNESIVFVKYTWMDGQIDPVNKDNDV